MCKRSHKRFSARRRPRASTSIRLAERGLYCRWACSPLASRVIDALFERDAACLAQNSPVKITRRQIDGRTVYFAINDSDTAWEGDIRFCGPGVNEQWDPATGVMTPLPEGKQVSVRLGPYGAMFFRSETADAPRRLTNSVATALAITCLPLAPTSKPTISQGQYVQSEQTGDDALGWRAAATLTKGDVDVFLFAGFAYEKPINLADAEGVAFDVSVPPEQTAPTELLVFLRMANGDRFLARTGRFLSEPGSGRAFVMFNGFNPFGETAGRLDLSQIASISIGWGGYFGQAGEQIVFAVKPPQKFVFGGTNSKTPNAQ